MKKDKEKISRLAQSIHSEVEAKAVLRQLDEILSKMHSARGSLKKSSAVLPAEHQQLLLKDMQSRGKSPRGEKARARLQEIKQEIQEMPKVITEMAFVPAAEFVEEMAEAISAMIGRPCLVETKYNPGIGGGVVIYYAGRIYDYSLKDKIDEVTKV